METTDIVANLGGPHKGKMFSAKDKDEDEELLSCAGKIFLYAQVKYYGIY